MTPIKEIILRIQIMELLQNTITDTINELENEISQATKDKLKIAQHSLSTEIMMNSLRAKHYSQPQLNKDEQQ